MIFTFFGSRRHFVSTLSVYLMEKRRIIDLSQKEIYLPPSLREIETQRIFTTDGFSRPLNCICCESAGKVRRPENATYC